MPRSLRRPGDIGYTPQQNRVGDVPPGDYQATVKDVRDPEKMGRVRLFIPALANGSESDQNQWTDWCMPKFPTGCFAVPDVDSFVWVQFEQGEFDFPTFGSTYYINDTKPPQLAVGESDGTEGTDLVAFGVTIPKSQAGSSEYPKNRVLRTAKGIVIEIDDTSNGRVRVYQPSGSFIELRDDGKVTIRASGKLALGGSSVEIAATGTVKIAGSSVHTGVGNTTHPGVHGDTLYTQLNALIVGLQAFTTGLNPGTLAAQATTLKGVIDALIPVLNQILATQTFTE